MMPAGIVALVVGRFLTRRWLHRQRSAGRLMSDVLVVGTSRSVKDLLCDLKRTPFAGYRVIGVCVRDGEIVDGLPRSDAGGTPLLSGVPVLGGLDDVLEIARSSGAHSVAVTATDSFGPAEVRKLSWQLEGSGVELILAPALTDIAGPRIHTQPVAGLPLIHVDQPTYRGANRILKKTFDLVGSALLLTLLSPILLATALAVKLTDRGPVFFRQERVGINGTPFKMIKFRSMVVNAEAQLAKLQERAGRRQRRAVQDEERPAGHPDRPVHPAVQHR